MKLFAVIEKELVTYFSSMLAYTAIARRLGTFGAAATFFLLVFLVLSGFYFHSNLVFFVVMGGFDPNRGLWQYQFTTCAWCCSPSRRW